MAENLDSPPVYMTESATILPPEPQQAMVSGGQSNEPSSAHSSGPSSGHSSTGSSPRRWRHRSRHGHQRRRETSPGAAWAPPYTAHEIHALEVYDKYRCKTSPTCKRFERDVTYEEINEVVVRKREDDADKSRVKALRRHKHALKVLRQARENERSARVECERYSHQRVDYGKRMHDRELAEKPEFRNRAEQELALGIHPRFRPGSA